MKDSKLEERKTNFQKNISNILEAREDYKLSLRKKNIDEFIFRKREKALLKNEERSKLEINVEELTLPSEVVNKTITSLNDFIEFTYHLLKSKDLNYLKFGLLFLRKHLSLDKNPPIVEVVNNGFLEILINILDVYITDESIVYEILWCFTNITANVSDKSVTNFFLTHKAYRIFDKIISNRNNELLSSLLWVLTHIVGDNDDARNGIANSSLFLKILDILEAETIEEKVLKTGLWFMGNLTKTCPDISSREAVERSIKILCSYVNPTRLDIACDSIWPLASFSDSRYPYIYPIIVDSGALRVILSPELESYKLFEPPFRLIGNLLSGDNDLIDKIISHGVINWLTDHLNNKYRTIRRECAWALSNIAAGTLNHIKTLINHPNCIPRVMELSKDPDLDVVKEAIWTITNCISGADIETCVVLYNMNVIDVYVYIISSVAEPSVLNIALEGLKLLFTHGEAVKINGANFFVQKFSATGSDYLEKLQSHTNPDIYNAVYDIIARFFQSECA